MYRTKEYYACLALSLCIREIVGSNLGLETTCSYWNIHGFPQFFQISTEAVPGVKQQLLPSINFQINSTL